MVGPRKVGYVDREIVLSAIRRFNPPRTTRTRDQGVVFDLRFRIATDRAPDRKRDLVRFLPDGVADDRPLLRWCSIGTWSRFAFIWEAVSRGDIRNLVINVPPGSAKSNTAGVIRDAWEWIHRPQTSSSFSARLTPPGRNSGRWKGDPSTPVGLVQAPLGDLLEPGKPAASMFDTRARGFRFATSPGGKGTGRHADIRVVDDP